MTPGKLFDFSKIKQEFSSGKKDGSNNGYKGFPGGSAVKNLPAVQEPQETQVLYLGSPGGQLGIPLKYSCLQNPMVGGAWWATVLRVAKSQTRLKQPSTHAQYVYK